ncbi:hypothetical protein B296_00054517 [Ensete ventricosum]|uniref:Membrane insertase YidC/Oxa/ALB C-terminal domain-containing protein n=1 Tax=Ensete ventricosum TaxID=4639 RepID=A0A426Y3J0_ENSVE|nr:hypothetical protein B296_00054517 [Ensete ventricosum]
MAKTLLFSPSSFLAAPLPSLSRRSRLGFPVYRPRRADTRVRMSFHGPPPPHGVDSLVDLHGIVSRVEGLLYTLADAAAAAPDASTAVQKNGGWFGFISDGMEVVLKVLFLFSTLSYAGNLEMSCTSCCLLVLKDGLSAIHVPYSYGFAIILLTVIVKVLTLPLTKKQVESTLAMQNLQPKIKAIQERYAGNQERIQLETARLYRQAGVNPLAGYSSSQIFFFNLFIS